MPFIFGELIAQSQLGHNGNALLARGSIPGDDIRAAYPKQDTPNSEIKYVKVFRTEFQLLNYCRAKNEEDTIQKRSASKHHMERSFMRYLRPIFVVNFKEGMNEESEKNIEWKKETLEFEISHKDGGNWKVAHYSKVKIQCEVEYLEVDINDLAWETGYLKNYNDITFQSPEKNRVSFEPSYTEIIGKSLGFIS